MTALEHLTVLLVDDDSVWITALASWLQREGYQVLCRSRGDGVTDALESHPIDAMILDVQLPGLDGLEVLDKVRRRRPGLPVIVTTAFGGPETGAVARRHGAAGYLEKPFRVAELVNNLRKVLTSCEQRPHGPRR